MICHTFILNGKPVAKARPRFFSKGKHVCVYNSQKATEGDIALEIKEQFIKQKGEILTGAIELSAHFVFKKPKKIEKYHTKKPDIDNLLKSIMDCMNGVVWIDDSQVAIVNMIKEYSEIPKTIIHLKTISELKKVGQRNE